MQILHKFFTWYFSRNALPYWCILAADSLIIYVFYMFGYYCFIGGDGIVDYFWHKSAMVLFCLLFYMVGFRLLHTYSNVIRYSSFVDLCQLACANVIGTACVLAIRLLFVDYDNTIFPGLRITLFAFCFGTLTMWAVRVLVKTLFDVVDVSVNARCVYIYGTLSQSVSIAKSVRSQHPSRYIVKGFISPQSGHNLKYLSGMPIYDVGEELIHRMKRDDIEGVIVSPQLNVEFCADQRFIDLLTDNGMKMFMMTEEFEWDGVSPIDQNNVLHEVSVEELLPRKQIMIDIKAVARELEWKTIFITGSAGSIGSELVRQIASFNPRRLVLIDQAETPQHDIRLMMAEKWPDVECHTIVGSICNEKAMQRLFAAYRPDYVFHAAAYKHVPMMEDNPGESISNNVVGTKVVADLAVKYGTRKFVMISTDKAVNPTNVMGCSKRICEIYVQSLDASVKSGATRGVTQFVTTRFGNVLGSNGSVIPLFREQIRRGGPVTVTHPEITRFFMLIPEACRLVLEAGVKGNGGEIFVFDMGESVKIADLAKRMIKLSGAKDIEIKYTGLRPGEKLYEEVLSSEEATLPSFHDKIRIAKVREYDYASVNRQIENLARQCDESTDMQVVKMMKEMVPEFLSKNSVYESLD
ncbi:MAG: nucleoside-diphosphate sugar epimerase/dehydratase [Prevotella sp.]|nr:nucleoside-diphosphate sugar epimerase/dehydratase [Prevotella sp.]